MNKLEASQLKYARANFGYFGGIGDPPDDETILAIIRAVNARDAEIDMVQDAG